MLEPRTPWKLYAAAAVLVALAPLALPIDLAVSSFALENRLPGDLRKLITLSETFGHGWGAAVILLSLIILSPQSRRCLPRLVTMVVGAGLLTSIVKLLVARQRPRVFDFSGTVWETFAGWTPWLAVDDPLRELGHDLQSFPSGHTGTAVALAIGLASVLPRGKWLFAVLAFMAAVQRIASGAHYVSDTLVGAALAGLWCGLCLDPRVFAGWFRRWELPPGERAKPTGDERVDESTTAAWANWADSVE